MKSDPLLQYVGQEDLTVFLARENGEAPTLVPFEPPTGCFGVGLSYRVGQPQIVVSDHPESYEPVDDWLWFCCIPERYRVMFQPPVAP
jgi:hypothetical protein